MNLSELNQLTKDQAQQEFYKCCACRRLCQELSEARPFVNEKDLLSKADSLWKSYSKSEFLEAFRGHSKIGDLDSLKKKYANTRQWSQQEQSGMEAVDEQTLMELMNLNDDYENRFGFIFIVCATGKSAPDMLSILKSRLDNSADQELQIAANEQAKITKIRLEKLLWA